MGSPMFRLANATLSQPPVDGRLPFEDGVVRVGLTVAQCAVQ